MADLTFKIQSGIVIDPSKTKPISHLALNAFKIEITNELKPYIDKINACGGKVVITVNQDGQTFTYQLLEMRDHDLFAQIIDELNSR
jgi:hypothetical protein